MASDHVSPPEGYEALNGCDAATKATVRSGLLAVKPTRCPDGGWERAGDEIRTRDILLGGQTLYQLSYSRVAANSISGALRAVVDPGLAFGVDLFLPDRHGVLQLVNQPLAGIERLTAMRRCHGNYYADLPDAQRASAVDNREVRDRPSAAGLLSEFLHLLVRHRAIGL